MIASEATGADDGLSALVSRIAGWLAHGGGQLSAGDASALRRMDPRHPHASFFKLVGLALEDQIPSGSTHSHDAETRWASVVVGVAHLGGLHQSSARLGRALVAAGFSEFRFARLLRGDSEYLVDELPMLARFLTAKDVPVDWSQAAWLLLSAGRRDEERPRRAIARDYYGALAKSTTVSSEQGESR